MTVNRVANIKPTSKSSVNYPIGPDSDTIMVHKGKAEDSFILS